jgi:hypothetical protein
VTDDLEAALREVGARLDVPVAPDPTAAVLAALDEPAPPQTGWRPVHRLVAAAAIALLALAAAMTVSPTVRAAVYDFLRIGGVEIHENQQPPVTPSVDPPLPGERDVSLAQARAEAPFALRLPAALGEPTNVRLADGAPPHVVSMAFGTTFGDVRVDQFDGSIDPMFTKFASAPDVHRVRVDDNDAIWVNRPHVVIYDRDGVLREETARLSGSTLIWEAAGITYRVEGALTESAAIAIAESLR